MSNARVHPILLLGLLSLAAGTLLESPLLAGFRVDLLRGFFDGLGLTSLLGSLLALRLGKLRQP